MALYEFSLIASFSPKKEKKKKGLRTPSFLKKKKKERDIYITN